MTKLVLIVLCLAACVNIVAAGCGKHCQVCNGPNQCTQCQEGFYFGQGGSCVCKVGHFDNGTNCAGCPANCAKCVNGAGCATCNGGYFLSNQGVCVACSTCSAGQYVASACSSNSQTLCGVCGPSCATCSGPNDNQCTSCYTAHHLVSGSCIACTICGSNQFQISPCGSTTDAQCGACYTACLTCNGPASNECTSCADRSYAEGSHYSVQDFWLNNGACDLCDTCPPGKYQTAACTTTADTQCASCSSTCLNGCLGQPMYVGTCPNGCTGPAPFPACN